MTKGRIATMIALLALVAAACGAGTDVGDDGSTTSPPTSAAPSTSLEPADSTVTPLDPTDPEEPDPGDPLPEQTVGKIPRALQPFADAAASDLAERLGVDLAAITVATAENVVWPDAALGCPQPGMAYAQVQVEGSRAVLIHGNVTYFYHGGEGNPGPFLCENLES